MDFQWVSAHISGFNIGAPTEYAHSILHVSDHLPPYVMTWAIPAIHEINALRVVLWQLLGKFLFKSIIALSKCSWNSKILQDSYSIHFPTNGIETVN